MELLAALSLFAIVMVLVSTTIFQSFKGEDQTSNQIEATQLANIALQDLKSQYQNKKETICIQQSELTIEISDVSNGVVKDNCIEEITPEEPIRITVTTFPQNGEPNTIQTAWANKSNQDLTVTIVETPDEEDNVIIDEEYIKKNGCYLNDSQMDFVYTLREITEDCTFVSKNGTFLYDISFYKYKNERGMADITVTGDVTFRGSISFDENNPNDAELKIDGNAHFGDIFINSNHTTITVKENATFKNVNLNNNHSSITVDKNGTFNGNINITSKDSYITIHGTASCNGDTQNGIIINESRSCGSN